MVPGERRIPPRDGRVEIGPGVLPCPPGSPTCRRGGPLPSGRGPPSAAVSPTDGRFPGRPTSADRTAPLPRIPGRSPRAPGRRRGQARSIGPILAAPTGEARRRKGRAPAGGTTGFRLWQRPCAPVLRRPPAVSAPTGRSPCWHSDRGPEGPERRNLSVGWGPGPGRGHHGFSPLATTLCPRSPASARRKRPNRPEPLLAFRPRARRARAEESLRRLNAKRSMPNDKGGLRPIGKAARYEPLAIRHVAYHGRDAARACGQSHPRSQGQ